MARRAAEACASSVVGGAAAAAAAASSRGKRVSTEIAYLRFPASRTFYHLSQRLTLFSSDVPSSSSAFPLSTSCASLSQASVGFRRPEEIPWQKDLANSIFLIGYIQRSVDIRYLDSGKIVASTAIRVKRSPRTEDTLFSLQFWDELAEIAAAHLKKEDHVYIAGSVWVENYVDKDNLQRSICKVVAKDLKFVGNDDRDGNSRDDKQPNQVSSVDDEWEDFFQNPSDYWDNRVGKKNPKSPDFKHKSTGIALWIDDKRNPSWVIDRLEQERPTLEENSEAGPRGGNSRADKQPNQVSSVDDEWEDYFQNPSDYWDNRVGKKNPKGPDFKHKSTGIALWIDNKRNPSWVIDRLEQERPTLEENSKAGPREDKLKEMEKLWQAFFANPSDWWDNRDSKKNAKFPDFKNKTNGEALWIEGYNNPSWVKSQLQAMDSKVKVAKDGGGRASGLKEKSSKTSFDDEDLGFF